MKTLDVPLLSDSAEALMKLIGFFIGDGHLGGANGLQFHIRKEREISFLHQVVVQGGFELTRWGESYVVRLPKTLRVVFDRCYDHQRAKRIPRFLLDLEPRFLRSLLEGLMHSDGSMVQRAHSQRWSYSTTSRRLADDVQELALRVGRSASIRPQPRRVGDGHYGAKQVWKLTIYEARNSQPGLCRTKAEAKNHMGVESYNGNIHCVTVPNGTLYVRRNGYPVWSGNSPFEHNSFRFHIRTPIFVAREWFRHRIGCLAGDTVVTFVNTHGQASKPLAKTMEELHTLWHAGERNGLALCDEQEDEVFRLVAEGRSTRAIARELGVGRNSVIRCRKEGTTARRNARTRLKKMNLRVLNEETNEFEVGHIADVVYKGMQPVFRLTLEDGKTLTATENHRLYTDNGWQTLREATGMVDDGAAAVTTKVCRLMVNGAPKYKDREWLERNRTAGLSVVDDLSELPQRKGVKLGAHPVRVMKIEYLGLERTYDLCVDGPWHNFVANGVVVHNSFNEESARYHKLADDFYVPEPEAVRSQVGKPGAYSFEPVDEELAEGTRDRLRRIYEHLYGEYNAMIEAGVAKELARSVLPFGIYTQFYWTINARALMNFLSLRNSEFAQYEIRVYAEAVERFFAQQMPITHSCFVEFGRRQP